MYPESFWKFINTNRSADPSALRLKYYGKSSVDFDVNFAILQIECRKKFGKKLAETLADNPFFIFPSLLAGEQSTSDRIASYHAMLLSPYDTSVADMTAGLGIDSMHMAKALKTNSSTSPLISIECDEEKAEALSYNAHGQNIEVICCDCRDWLENKAKTDGSLIDVLFIDPARRAADGSRIYALADCSPDVVSILPTMRKVAKRLIVKASPMLDVTRTALDLQGITRIIALGTTTECKELDAIVNLTEYSSPTDYEIEATTLTADSISTFTFTPQQERDAAADCTYRMPKEGDYLFEAYPAVMKAAPFNLLSKRYGIDKLHTNTHLYVSAALTDANKDFPGEIWKIEKVLTYESKHIKRFAKQYPQISVATRNFDVAPDTLRKKLGVKDGGTRRLFAVTSTASQKLLLITSPLR